MMVRYLAGVTGALLLLSMLSQASAADPALERCQQLKSEIEHYDRLRRKGGKGSEMDSWKRSRRTLEKAFRAQGCHYHRRALK